MTKWLYALVVVTLTVAWVQTVAAVYNINIVNPGNLNLDPSFGVGEPVASPIILVNSSGLIRFHDLGHEGVPGSPQPHYWVVQVSSGQFSGLLSYEGHGLITITIYPNMTFSATNGIDQTISGPIGTRADELAGDQAAFRAALQRIAAAIPTNPNLLDQLRSNPISVLEQYQFPLVHLNDEEKAQLADVLTSYIESLSPGRFHTLSASGSTSTCWGCRLGVGSFVVTSGAALVIGLGGPAAVAASGGFVNALVVALGASTPAVEGALAAASTASSAYSVAGFINSICSSTYIHAC